MQITNIAQTSQEFRKYFLLKLTKELIMHVKLEEFFALNTEIRKKEPKMEMASEEKDSQEVFKDFEMSIMNEHPITRKINELRNIPPMPQIPRSNVVQKMLGPSRVQQTVAPMPVARRPLSIPNYPLPPTVSYLKPIPVQSQIDLGKLNSVIQDPGVSSIECQGENIPLTTKGSAGKRKTNVSLTKEEISQIFETFSIEARIPLHEGVFKAAVGQLVISAIISDIVGSQFIIRKIFIQNTMTQMYRY